jgi:hypothetical protein
MLLPDNIHPEQTVYFNASVVLDVLLKTNEMVLFELYIEVTSIRKMSFPLFLLSLDWLFVIDVVEFIDNGGIKVCI